MTVPLNPKQKVALAFIEQHKCVLVNDVAKAIGDDPHTARNVLEQLRRRGHLKKTSTSKVIFDPHFLRNHKIKVVCYELVDG